MPMPTTRAGRYHQRRLKYQKRGLLLKKHFRRFAYHDHHGTEGNHQGRAWSFTGTGATQQPLHVLLVKHRTHGPLDPQFPPFLTYAITTSGKRKTPHAKITSAKLIHHHTVQDEINYHHRAQTYRGRKVGRLNGFDRTCYFAWRSFMGWKRYNHGVGAWPTWDPLHRTPVQPPP